MLSRFAVPLVTSLLAVCAGVTSAQAVGETWRYYRVGSTGIQGDYSDALWIGPDGNPYIGGYDPIFEEGGISRFVRSDNRWINYSNVDYPVIGHPDETGTVRVSDIVADAQGRLWMGTGIGALRFDPELGPASFVRYTPANSTLPGGWTSGVEVAPDGTIWFSAYGTVSGSAGLARFDPATNAWASFGQFGDGSLAVQPKPTSGYYVWTKNPWDGKVARWDSGTQAWTEYSQVTNAPWDLAGKGSTDAAGNTWMYRLTGPSYALTTLDCRRPDGTWIGVSLAGLPAGFGIGAFRAFGTLQALLVDGNGETWRFNGASWTSLGTWRPGAYTEDVGMDDAGNVWVCGIGGAGRRDAATGIWQRYRITNTGLFDNFPTDLTIDPVHGLVYVGANAAPGVGGMARFDGKAWTGWNNSTYGLGHDWPFDAPTCQALAYRRSNDHVAVNPYWGYGIHEWNGSTFSPLPSLSGVKRLCEDSMGRLWGVGEYFSLFMHDGIAWRQLPLSGWGANVRPDPSRPGTVWAWTGFEFVRTDGVSRLSRTIADFPELANNTDQFTGVAVDPDGIAWIGATAIQDGPAGYEGALIRFDSNAGTYQIMRSAQGWPFPGKLVTPWAVTPDGRVWMQYDTYYPYTVRGLLWYDGNQIGTFPAPPGGEPQWGSLPHGQVEDLEVRFVPGAYELWMTCASRGVAVLNVPFAGVAVEDPPSVPDAELAPSRPNPMRTTTTISFAVPRAERVNLVIYDVQGRIVRRLADEHLPAGRHQRAWDRTDAAGRTVASGVYYCRLRAGEADLRRKLLVLD